MGDRDHIRERKSPHRRYFTCPVCKRRVPLTPDRSTLPEFYPFCSERCKLIDLGAWLDAKYRIPDRPDEGSEPPQPQDPGAGAEHPEK